jgi:replicative DNA helicase
LAQRAPLRPVTSNRIPPHNLDAEQSVLGAMLESREAIANVIDVVDPDDFYKPAHSQIFQIIIELYGRGEPADAITVADELGRRGWLETIGGRPYIVGLLEAYPTASSARHYAHIVEEHALLRKLVEAGAEVQELGFSLPEDVTEAVDDAERIIYEVGDRRLREDIQPIKPLLAQNMEAIERLYEAGDTVTGLASGFPDLDEMTLGFQPSTLNIVAARPSMGKSALLGDFALHAAVRQRKTSVMFSLEMSRHEVVQRFLASEAKVDSQRLRRGSLQEQDWTRLSSALGRLAEAPIFIDDSANITMMEMRAKCRRLKARHGLGLVIVDYLQLMQSPRRSENRQQEVSEISRSLKILAKELQVPVLCASQLNRMVETRSDKRPFLGDLRESGCLTGDTLVTLASGRRVPIAELVGTEPEVVSMNGWKLSSQRASKVWCTGRKPVFRLTTLSGRSIRATMNHPFRQLSGWTPLGKLSVADRIAIPRRMPASANRDDRGASHFRSSPSRSVLSSYACVLDAPDLQEGADSDVYWDEISSIEADGETHVFDMTVSQTHNFVADGIIVHNSIEQDSDMVMFIYRDEVYNPESDARGEAELIVAKHRNGPTGMVRLAFMNQYTKFASIARSLG